MYIDVKVFYSILAVKPVLRTGVFNVSQLYLPLPHKYGQLNKLSQLTAFNCDCQLKPMKSKT